MELNRDIYQDLLKWKQLDSGKVLELKGARQVGKTFILDKFARENYKHFLYINMLHTSGAKFLQCYEEAAYWKPGMDDIAEPIHATFRLFKKDFSDDKDTIVVIDEIQESAKVYSLIRQFAREFQCHFIVTGSYLGKTVEREYFLPAGDTDNLTLYTLSFEEFLGAFDKRDLYDGVGLYGESPHGIYDELKSYYEIYCQIGGYPKAVSQYLQTQDMKKSKMELLQIIQIFIEESQRYFKDILEINLFEQVFPAIARSMAREKKGSADLITELSSIIYKEDSNRITKASVNHVIAWLYRSHIIGLCGKAIECNPMDVAMNNRFYFLDVGVCNYFLMIAGADQATCRGIVNENFIYIDLHKRVKDMGIAGISPMFGTYKEGEIDFLVRNMDTFENYGIEVKAGKSAGKTAQLLLKDHKVAAVYFLKGDTYGGWAEKMATIPIYLVKRVRFDYKNERHP